LLFRKVHTAHATVSEQPPYFPVTEAGLCEAPGEKTLGQHSFRKLLIQYGGTFAGTQQFTHLLQEHWGILAALQQELFAFCVAEFQCLKKDGLELFRG
jgi:hypothetical protein